MTSFSFLREDLFSGREYVGVKSADPLTVSDWLSGKALTLTLPATPTTLELTGSPEAALPEFFDTSVPLMSTRLIDWLRRGWALTLETHPVVLVSPHAQKPITHYCAVNVVGVADAISLERSPHRLRFRKPYFTGGIEVDGARAPVLDLFRVDPGPALMVVSERLAQALRAQPFVGITLQATTAYEGV